MNAYREGYEAHRAVVAYFSRDPRPKFCTTFCVQYSALSDTCAVAEGREEPSACPELANITKEAA